MNLSIVSRKINRILLHLETMDDKGAKLIEENKMLKAELSDLRNELAEQVKLNGTLKGELTRLKNKHNKKNKQ